MPTKKSAKKTVSKKAIVKKPVSKKTVAKKVVVKKNSSQDICKNNSNFLIVVLCGFIIIAAFVFWFH
jgi:hypothetical protein